MRLAYRELLSPSMIRMVLATVALVVAVMTVVGPFGTYITLTPLDRLAYFSASAFLGCVFGYSLNVVTLYFMRFRSRLSVGLGLAAAAAVGAVPCAAIAYGFQALFYPEYPDQMGLMKLYSMAATVAVACSFLLHYALCQRLRYAGEIGAHRGGGGAVAAHEDVDGEAATHPMPDAPAPASPMPPPTEAPDAPLVPPASSESAPVTEEDAEPRPAFLQRLPVDVPGDLIYLQTENHYIHVYTSAGSCRVLFRFADAVAELGGRGMQVHRSYWVAHRHVIGVVRRDNRMMLRLTGDHAVPVSRTYLPAVNAALSS